MKKQELKILDTIAQVIFDKKGFNILVLDINEVSTMADYFVIAEGQVDRHVKSISQAIISELIDQKIYPLRSEGQALGNWIVIDYGYIVIHLFTTDLRQKYALEKLWSKGEIVDVNIDIKRKGLEVDNA